MQLTDKQSFFHPALLLAFGLFCPSTGLQAGTLGIAQGWGAFIFGNSTDTADIASRIAVGGYFTGSAGVGGQIQASVSPSGVNSNVVALIDGSQANNGININVGQAAYNAGGNVANGTKLSSDPLGSVASYRGFYQSLSSSLAGLTPSAGYSVVSNGGQGNKLNITSTASTVVAYMAASDWANLANIVPGTANQTIIIDITGYSGQAGTTGYNMQFNGTQPGNTGAQFQDVLFNFGLYSGTINLGNEGYGTILAPNATVEDSGKVVNGGIVAYGLGSIGELHDASNFNGNLPAAGAVPEPATWTLIGGVLAALCLYARSRRRREVI